MTVRSFDLLFVWSEHELTQIAIVGHMARLSPLCRTFWRECGVGFIVRNNFFDANGGWPFRHSVGDGLVWDCLHRHFSFWVKFQGSNR